MTRNSVSPKEISKTHGVTPEKCKNQVIAKKVAKKGGPIKASPVKSQKGQDRSQIHKELSELSNSLSVAEKKPLSKEQA